MNPAIIAAAIQAAATIGSAVMNKSGDEETRMQRKQRHLVDDLLKSLNGGGKYSDLFSTDEAAFNKGFRDPAMSQFRNQTAPQIQQEYIQSGQQRGTGLDDQLLRAGVDMDTILNQAMFDYQQKGLDRKANALSGILGMGSGAVNPMSTGQAVGQGASAYLNSEGFRDTIADLTKKKPVDNQNNIFNPPRTGYTQQPFSLPKFDSSLRTRSY